MSPQQTSQSCGFWLSSQSVLTFDLRGLEAADAGMDAGTCSHYESEQHFICPWGISKANFHGIEVTPHVRGVDVRNRHIEPRPWAAHFLRSCHDRLGVFQNLT